MTDEASLQGLCVLVIEDDYYLANDNADLLREAGATVVACIGDADDALHIIEQKKVNCALVDINLGLGPDFDTARALRSRNIPFLFTTGYDAASIPSEFGDVSVLEKPIDERLLLEAVKGFI